MSSKLSRPGAALSRPGASVPGAAPPGPQSEERERRADVVRKARDFLIHVETLGRLLNIHEPANAAVQTALKDLVKDVRELQATGEDLSLIFAEGHAFVNGVWVRATRRAWDAALKLTSRLESIESRGLVLESGLGADALLALTDYLRQAPLEGGAEKERFENAALAGIRVVPLPSAADRARAGRSEAREEALEIFRAGLEAVNRTELAKLDLYVRRRQRALVQRLIQMAEEDPENLLTLTAMRDPTLSPRAHNMMVCIYAICLGRLLDLSRSSLVRLGMCALNHNVGETLLPSELFSVERELEPGERSRIEQHPLLGAGHLLRHYGYSSAIVERALVAAEHHAHYDGSDSYPFPVGRKQHVFSRIVAVADVFDALCSPRPHRAAFPPDQAIKLVNRQGGRKLDPVIVRRLLWLVGRYPPGSLVELDSGEWAVVLGPGRGAYPLVRPRVLLISDEDGFELPTPVEADLGERHPRRRAWLRTIARTRDPHKMGLNLVSYLFGERIVVEAGRMDIDELEAE